jgi:uncharacterized protein YfaS (alpha-2-macroglobulin family)
MMALVDVLVVALAVQPASETASKSAPQAGQLMLEAVAADAQQATPSAPLAVQYSFPAPNDVEVDTQARILVQFTRPVAPLAAIAQRADRPALAFDPPVPGSGKWLTSALYVFQPQPGLQAATTYQVQVLTDLSDLPGGSLAEPYAFSFTTIAPAVADVAPRGSAKYVEPSAGIQLLFNQPVDRPSAEAAFSLTSDAGSVSGSFEWANDQTVVFHPDPPLARGATMQAHVATGVRGISGGQSPKPYDWSFAVVPDPRVLSTAPADGDGAASLGSMSISFSAPMEHASTEAAIQVSPAPDGDSPLSFFWIGDDRVTIGNYPLTYATRYGVTVGGGATDRYGVPIVAPYTASSITKAPPPPQPGASILAGAFGTFSAYLPAVIDVQCANMAQLDFTLYPHSTDEFRSLLQRGYVDRTKFQPAATAVRSWSVPVEDAQPNQAVQTQVTIGDLLPSGGTLAPGLYLLDVVRNNPPAGASPVWDTVAFEVSRTNVAVKRGADDTLVWAADLSNGQPVASAPVTITDGSGTTGADGTLLTTTPRVATSSDGPLYVQVTRPDDVAFATQNWTGPAPPRVFNVSVSLYPPVTLRGYLYTDRPIYRAGETVHLRFIARADDDGAYVVPADAGPLTVKVHDSRYTLVQSLDAELDGFGSLTADVTLPEEAATGNCFVEVLRGTDRVGSGSFLVAEFRAPEFTVALTPGARTYVNGSTIAADVQADLFFGAHLADAELSWVVTASPYSFSSAGKAFAGYSFSDFEATEDKHPGPNPVAQGSGRTDLQGHAAFDLPASLGAYPASQTFTITATITDANRQQVSASQTVVVHRASLYAGVQPDGYPGTAGSPMTLGFAAVDTSGTAAPGVPLTTSVYRRQWVNTRKQQPDGSERLVSTPKDTLLTTQSVVTGADGKTSYAFAPPNGGEYRVTVAGRDALGNSFQAANSFYARSSDPQDLPSWRIYPESKMTLVADQATYAPGDTAHVLVPAPFADAVGLVTVERGRIRSYATRRFSATNNVVDVPISADMAPTVYLSVMLFKPGQEREAIESYRVGYLKLTDSAAGKALTITLTPDREKLGPGDTVTFVVRATDANGNGVPAEVSLALVDKAVLSLADERGGSIFDSFYSARSLGVGSGATLAISINAANQARAAAANKRPQVARTATPAAPGALPANDGGGGSVNPVRSDFQNTAFWRGDVQTDASGAATVSIKLPDNLTTWRLSARGITVDIVVGDGQASIQTAKELIVRPAAPRFFTAGDQTRLETLVTNNGTEPLDVDVSLQAEGLTINSGTQRVSVAPGRSAKAGWDTVAGEDGPAKLTFGAVATNGQSDAVALTLPINPRSTPETVASSGIVPGEGTHETVVIPGNARQDKGGIDIVLNATLSGILRQASLFLEQWHYEPADVTAARLVDRVARLQAARTLQRPEIEQDDALSVARAAIRRLQTIRTYSGWGWWVDSPPSPDITAQVLFALGAAREAGLEVDPAATADGARYLFGVYDQSRDVAHPLDPNQRAFWLLAAAMAGNGSKQRELALAANHHALADSGKGALLQALLIDGTSVNDYDVRALEGELTTSAIVSAAGTHWEDVDSFYPNYANSTRATALVVRGLLRLDPNQPLLGGAMRWLSGTRSDGYWRSLRETVLAINAVGAYVVTREPPPQGLTYQVGVDGRAVAGGAFADDDPFATVELDTPLGGLPADAPLPVDIAKGGSGQLYYGIYLHYFAPTEEIGALSNGLTIARELWSADTDTPVTSVQAGGLVRVHLTIAARTNTSITRGPRRRGRSSCRPPWRQRRTSRTSSPAVTAARWR